MQKPAPRVVCCAPAIQPPPQHIAPQSRLCDFLPSPVASLIHLGAPPSTLFRHPEQAKLAHHGPYRASCHRLTG